MKGNIYTREKCFVCGSNMPHDDRRRGCYCPNHPQASSAGKFFVKFGRDIFKNFKHYIDAERFLTGLRYETDKGSFDIRDYRADNPLGFEHLANKWIDQKSRTNIKPKTVTAYRNFMGRAITAWRDTNVKLIGTAAIDDFLFDDHHNPDGKPISDKTRANMKSCLHDFWTWLVRRERRGGRGMIEMPDFPEIKFELGYRNVVSIEDQQRILDEIYRISHHINPKIWLGIKLLATYVKIRPGELRSVLERHIDLENGVIIIPHPKEGKPKYAFLSEQDVELIAEFPMGLPDIFFFRHLGGVKGMKPGAQFGPKYFKGWWDRACANLGIEGVDLYGGTKHSTVVALGKVLSPEQIRRGGTGHTTNKAFERYLMPDKTEGLMVTAAVEKLREKGRRADVVDIGRRAKK